MRDFRYLLLITIAIFGCGYSYGREMCVPDSGDAVAAKPANVITKLIRYFEDSNKSHPEKKFDISFIGGPHYSSDAGFGVGLLATGLYRNSPADTIYPPSSVSLFVDATTNMFFTIGIDGCNIFAGDRCRLNYNLRLHSKDLKFWGIGYDMASNDNNESKFRYIDAELCADLVFRIGRHLYMGPLVDFAYIHGADLRRPELLCGEPTHTFSYGAGLKLSLDTRDFLTNAYHGVYLSMQHIYYPSFIGNKYAFSVTDVTTSVYNRVWKGGVIASRFHGRFTQGHAPWGMLSQLGSDGGMRGYYEGRYRDKCAMDVCVELRQHVYRRSGAVVWLGAGTVFPRFSNLRFHEILPNYGIGYRWEFKHRVNVRFDIGFGKHSPGFMFNINEAF